MIIIIMIYRNIEAINETLLRTEDILTSSTSTLSIET